MFILKPPGPGLQTLVLGVFGLCLALSGPLRAEPAALTLTLDPRHIERSVSPSLYGLMTEEINHSADGGLYAEMVQNRAFHTDWNNEAPWDLVRRGDAVAHRSMDHATGPSPTLGYSLKLEALAASPGNEAGLTNPGYWGFGLRPHTAYQGSFFAKSAGDAFGDLEVRLVANQTGQILATTKVALRPGDWRQYRFSLTTGDIQPSAANHLELLVDHPGVVWLQLVSLMPPTYKDRANGNRIDLMEKMAALHPKFLRLPGGNFLEGMTPESWYDWKKTIGPLTDRPGHDGAWFYRSSDGLGLLEYLEWCEDLGIEPVLAVYAGYSLGGAHIETGKALQPYVQSALDEIEFVSGDASTPWGAVRARNGHPAPFALRYVEIGNEDYLDRSGSYGARYAQFAAAIRQHYPKLQLIATDGNLDFGTRTRTDADVSDEHFYESPSQMMDLAHHYDAASRSGPKIFVGEWATRSGSPTPNFGDALGDAAWMTGLERNSDLIIMAAYAPLLANINPGALQWETDLIGFDALSSYGSPSYWAQTLFAGHIGDGYVASDLKGDTGRFFSSATFESGQKVLHLKLVNASTKDAVLHLTIQGLKEAVSARVYSLHAPSFDATNSLRDPDAIRPVHSTVAVPAGSFDHRVPALTIEVLDIPWPSAASAP